MINQSPTHRLNEPIPIASFPDVRTDANGGNPRLLPTRENFRYLCTCYAVSIWTAFPSRVFRADIQAHGVPSLDEAALQLDDLCCRSELPVSLSKIRQWLKAEAKLQSLHVTDEERLNLDSGVFKPMAKPFPANQRIPLTHAENEK